MADDNVKRVELVKAVAKLLPGFEYHVPFNGTQPRLVGEDDLEIFIGGSQQRGKLHVHGGWPMDGHTYMSPRSWGAVPYGETGDVSINVSEDRGPEAIARDILRRFLPQYREIHAKCREKQREHSAYENRLRANAVVVAEAAGLALPETKGRNEDYRLHLNGSNHGWYGTVVVNETSVSFDVRTVPTDKALRILAILQEKENGGKR